MAAASGQGRRFAVVIRSDSAGLGRIPIRGTALHTALVLTALMMNLLSM